MFDINKFKETAFLGEEIPQEIVASEEPVITEEPVQEEVVEEVVEETEEVKEAPKPQPVQPVIAPVEVAPPLDPVDFLFQRWGESHGITKDHIKENMGEFVNVVKDLQEEIHALKKQNATYEAVPEVQQRKQVAAFEEMWNANGKDWEDELLDAYPEQMKLLAKLGKKKSEEFSSFLTEELGNYALPRLAAGKKVSNPLLAIGAKLASKIDELAKPEKPVAAPAPKAQAPQKPSAKQLMSLGGAETAINDKAPTPKGIAPGALQAMQNVQNLMNGFK